MTQRILRLTSPPPPDSRSFLNARYRSLLHAYILSPPDSPPPQGLIELLESPRIKFVNLSYLDDDTGTSLLHEAAKRRDLRLIELAVRAGADVFVRNRRGKMPYEGTGKDDKVRVFLRQCVLRLNPALQYTDLSVRCQPRRYVDPEPGSILAATVLARLPQQVYQRRKGLQHAMVRPEGRRPLM